MRAIVLLIGALGIANTAIAHPNHVADGAGGLTHLFADPFHVGALVVSAGTAYVASRAANTAQPRRWIAPADRRA